MSAVACRVAVACLVTLVAGCGARSASPPRLAAVATPTDLIVLLPDDGTGKAGRAVVSNTVGAIELAAAGAWTRVAAGAAPAAPQVMSDGDIRAQFGDVVAALPPPVATYTLYFRFDSEALTSDSRAHLEEVLDALRKRPAAEVIIVGHSDRAGAAASNAQLALQRARTVRQLLVDARVEPEAITVSSQGEAEPLVVTADDVVEPRNRRVEVTVR